jgi:hypothetical protein
MPRVNPTMIILTLNRITMQLLISRKARLSLEYFSLTHSLYAERKFVVQLMQVCSLNPPNRLRLI